MLNTDKRERKKSRQYLSIIIDGMDQSKTNIPHIVSNPKVMAGAYRLETHITGVKVHGRFTKMFIDSGQFNHDSNLAVQVLLRVFYQLM